MQQIQATIGQDYTIHIPPNKGFIPGAKVAVVLKEKKISSKAKIDHAVFLKMLKETRGAWGPASQEELAREKEQRKLELKASARRKRFW